MKHRVCSKCGQSKALTQFYRDAQKTSGLRPDCKECSNMIRGLYRRSPHGREVCHQTKLRYKHTPKGRLVARRAAQAQRQRDPDKYLAHALARNAMRRGELTPPDKCEQCNSGGKLEKHHPDYRKPLEVVWVYKACHTLLHIKEMLCVE